MKPDNIKNIANFFVAGISYKKTGTDLRGKFAVNSEQYSRILTAASSFRINDFFILSTCNRTEVFGFATSVEDLIELLCSQTAGSKESFLQIAYTKNGADALAHLFNVSVGLDSQLLGDYEIIGQLKQAVSFSKKFCCLTPLLERIVDFAIQASKSVKNKTMLSSGTVSVSFAAVQFIKEKVANIKDKKILLIGVGKIGRTTCKNMVDYLHTNNITLINRSEEKAASLAQALQLQHSPIENLPQQVAAADIILVATSAPEPAILKKYLQNNGEKLIIDLSVPGNVEREVKDLEGVTLINVDELSVLKDETLKRRRAEIPVAEQIVTNYLAEFMYWYRMRQHVTVLKAVKIKLREMSGFAFPALTNKIPVTHHSGSTEKIQQVINVLAFKMRSSNRQGCYYIEAINEFMSYEHHDIVF